MHIFDSVDLHDMPEPVAGAEGGVETEEDEELQVFPTDTTAQEETVVVKDGNTLPARK